MATFNKEPPSFRSASGDPQGSPLHRHAGTKPNAPSDSPSIPSPLSIPSAPPPPLHLFRLIVGLGNPGTKYVGTRHNIGFAVVEELARRAGTAFTQASRWKAATAQCEHFALMKPLTYMNLSGEAVVPFARYYKIAPAETLVILDDITLPLGTLRFRGGGSSGGHNGLGSICDHFDTDKIPRLRVGVGASNDAPQQIPLEIFVLSRFASSEQTAAEATVLRAADAVPFANDRGLEAAMNQFNQRIT